MASSNEDFIERMLHRKDKSILNFIIIGVNIVIFILTEFTGGTDNSVNMIRWGAAYTPLVASGEYYRLFTSMFLHFGFRHLLSNMVLLFFIGDYMERYLGRIRYLILYLAGGLAGSFLSYSVVAARGEAVVSAGASGAIFAVLGALAVMALLNHGRLEDLTLVRILIMAGLSIWVGFSSPGVDGFAHLGGFLGGCIIALLYAALFPRFRYRRT